ncbi:tetratricopeptide repeat protein [Burkholderia plantarii]|uniref:tetratricopeptide repeat protein n=1 Tax=Burkholderia plantarii TaxID=41899 RepID=UPI0008709FA4|nr:tetratricopeptide repeat protein [Burkholderia plantarii]
MISKGEGTTFASPAGGPGQTGLGPPDDAVLERLLARARRAHHEGALQQAEQAYQELLALDAGHPEALHLLGAVRFQQGRLDEAEPLMRRSVERRPVALALANYSAVLAGLGREAEALSRLDEALALQPGHQRALFQRAGLLARFGRHDAACENYDRLLEQVPNFADGYVRRGEARQALGRLEEALRDCDRALQLAGRTFDAQRARGLVLRSLGRFRDAVDSYGHALALAPGHVETLFLRGVAWLDLQEPARALADFNSAVAAHPGFVDALFNSTIALGQLGRHAEVLARCDRVLELDPRHALALAQRGNAAAQLGRIADALDSYARALEVAPDAVGVLCNQASALTAVGRHDEARAACDRALAIDAGHLPARFVRGRALLEAHHYDLALDDLDAVIAATPDDKLAHFHRGNALRALRRHDEARRAYADAIAIDPGFVQAQTTRSFLCLATGDFETGWDAYEWRWRDTQLDPSRRTFAQPRWKHGMPLDGRTILLYAEQGLGDTLQFCRYAPLVKALGARVVLEVQPELVALLGSLDGVDALVARDAPLPPFDLHCPLMSLPLEFRTDLDSIPAAPSYLRADPLLAARWRERFGGAAKPRIGVVWSGNPLHLNDRNRSIRLADLLPLVDDRHTWVSLQKMVRDEDRAALDASAIHFVGDELADFAETAALIETMDCVISVDTSVAHLAGALGRPLVVLLPYTPDFRWLLDRDDSPWYPGARLIRQSAGGQWASVIERLAAALPAIARGSGR